MAKCHLPLNFGGSMSYLASCDNKEAKSMIGLINQINIYKIEVRKRRMQELQDILKDCKEQRSINRLTNSGWSRSRTRRAIASIPTWIVFDKEYGKYFDPRIPYKDRAKEQDKFLKRFKNEVGDLRVID